MSLAVNIGGVYKDMHKGYVNIGGVWKEIDKIFCNIGGVWKEGYSAATTYTWSFRTNQSTASVWSLLNLETGAVILDVPVTYTNGVSPTDFLSTSRVSPIDGSLYYISYYRTFTKITISGAISTLSVGYDFKAFEIDFKNDLLYTVSNNKLRKHVLSSLSLVLSKDLFTIGVLEYALNPLLNTAKSRIRVDINYTDEGDNFRVDRFYLNTSDFTNVGEIVEGNVANNLYSRKPVSQADYVFDNSSTTVRKKAFNYRELASIGMLVQDQPPSIAAIDDIGMYAYFGRPDRVYKTTQDTFALVATIMMLQSSGGGIRGITAIGNYIYVTVYYTAVSYWINKINKDNYVFDYNLELPSSGSTFFCGHMSSYY